MPYDHAAPKGVVHQGFCDGDTGVVSRRSPTQASMKRQMFLAYASQCSALAKFDPEIERFRIVGGAMFKTLPNNGMLLYQGLLDELAGAISRRMPAAFRKSQRASATTEGLNETTEGPSMLVRTQSLVPTLAMNT